MASLTSEHSWSLCTIPQPPHPPKKKNIVGWLGGSWEPFICVCSALQVPLFSTLDIVSWLKQPGRPFFLPWHNLSALVIKGFQRDLSELIKQWLLKWLGVIRMLDIYHFTEALPFQRGWIRAGLRLQLSEAKSSLSSGWKIVEDCVKLNQNIKKNKNKWVIALRFRLCLPLSTLSDPNGKGQALRSPLHRRPSFFATGGNKSRQVAPTDLVEICKCFYNTLQVPDRWRLSIPTLCCFFQISRYWQNLDAYENK